MSFFKKEGQEGKTGSHWGCSQCKGEGYKKRIKEAESSGNVICSCMRMEKCDLLKLFKEEGRRDK
jgi:hypothetical protein